MRPGAAALGVAVFGALSFGRAMVGCVSAECEHDWQCGASSICIPYDGQNACYEAPVCTSSAECAGGKGCIVRSARLVNKAARDPFTSSEPGKRTCGGADGPPAQSTQNAGCGYSPVGNSGGAGGASGWSATATASHGSATAGATTTSTTTTGTTTTGAQTSSSGSTTTGQTSASSSASGTTSSSAQATTSVGSGG